MRLLLIIFSLLAFGCRQQAVLSEQAYPGPVPPPSAAAPETENVEWGEATAETLYYRDRMNLAGQEEVLDFAEQSNFRWKKAPSGGAYLLTVFRPQQGALMAALARASVPSLEALVEVEEPQDLRYSHLFRGDQGSARETELLKPEDARRHWRAGIEKLISSMVFEFEGVEKVEVSFEEPSAEKDYTFLVAILVEVSTTQPQLLIPHLEGLRTQLYLCLDNQLPLQNIVLTIR